METSLRYWGDSKSLRFHAKEKIPIDSKTRLQVQGELDTRIGAPTFVHAMIRRFYPDISGSLGVGLLYEKNGKVRYTVRGKKSFDVTSEGALAFIVKARSDVDQEFGQWKSRGAAEFALNIKDFQKDQDVRVKVGLEVFDQPPRKDTKEKQKPLQQIVPYLQIRENNWTLNADVNGKWNVRYDL
ncbi:outer envelope pore protein 21B, chloroplastic-like [Punica granatum]|uniref:Outer envelope pore protein 21B, chloroplastic-like n=1 Tax=Punica granatum TaxID=22663 RepID=A0A6P8EAF7_PUNGR|nr:outer envelope pore protein 21B, chloroplastic-like [Punica granatum]